MTLQSELADVINRHCIENHSNTPDFLLAQYLMACLSAYQTIVCERDRWYARAAPDVPESTSMPPSDAPEPSPADREHAAMETTQPALQPVMERVMERLVPPSRYPI